MSDALLSLLIKACTWAGAIALAYGAWQWNSHHQRELGRAEILQTAAAAASAARAANAATTAARADAAAKGYFRYLERAKDQEARYAQDRARAAADRGTVERLRHTAVAGDRRARGDAVDTCSAEHQQRDARLDRLLAQGQRLAIEGAELAAEGGELVDAGARGLAATASLIELANDWARAVKLGEKPP